MKEATLAKLLRYSELKTKSESMDGYSRGSSGEKAGGRGPLSDPTANTVIGRGASEDIAWLQVIDAALTQMGDEARTLAVELWIKPAIPHGEPERMCKIADRLHISPRVAYRKRDMIILEIGSMAAVKGLLKFA